MSVSAPIFGMEVEYAKSNLKTSVSQILGDLSLASFCQSRAAIGLHRCTSINVKDKEIHHALLLLIPKETAKFVMVKYA